MWAIDLANIARTTGLPVVEQAGWKTRGVRALSGIRAVVCHHTAGAATGDAPSLNVVQNGRSDLQGPLAQFVLGRSGTIYVVAAGACNHAGATINDAVFGNSYSIGIEAENTGSQPWPYVQVDAYARLCAALCFYYGIPVNNVQGHKEICSPHGRKSDPNGLPGDMGGLRYLTQSYINGTAQASPPAAVVAPVIPPDEEPQVFAPASPTTTTFTFPLPGFACRIVVSPGTKTDGTTETAYISGIKISAGYTDDLGTLKSNQGSPGDNFVIVTHPEIYTPHVDGLKAVMTYSSNQPIAVAVYRV